MASDGTWPRGLGSERGNKDSRPSLRDTESCGKVRENGGGEARRKPSSFCLRHTQLETPRAPTETLGLQTVEHWEAQAGTGHPVHLGGMGISQIHMGFGQHHQTPAPPVPHSPKVSDHHGHSLWRAISVTSQLELLRNSRLFSFSNHCSAMSPCQVPQGTLAELKPCHQRTGYISQE